MLLELIGYIEKIGIAREKLNEILDLDIWDDLSKHNPYWESQYEPECDKLDDARRRLAALHEQLLEIHLLLKIKDKDVR
jgi:hypothetical protein